MSNTNVIEEAPVNQNPVKKSGIACNIMLLVAAIIWGAGTSAQSAGMSYVSPLTFNAARFFIGGTIALGFLFFFSRRQKAMGEVVPPRLGLSKGTIIAGCICGGVLCVAINLMQFGLLFTPVAKASFIISLYVIMVPIASLLFFKKKAPVFVWIGMSIAVTGMYFLTLSGGVAFRISDILVFLCAMAFATQIFVIGHFSPKHNVLALASVQFYTVAIISLVLAFIFETPSITGLVAGLPFVLYTGILSSGVAYILQMKAMKTANPTVAAVIFSFESVVATIASWLFLGQILSPRELFGCALIFAAVLVAQIPPRPKVEVQP